MKLPHLLAVLSALALLSTGCRRSIDRQLIGSAAKGNVAEIDRLLSYGANLNCDDGSLQRWTPLHWAVYESQERAVSALLAAGANPNAKDGKGWTPLMYATEPGIIRALVLAGARTDGFNLDSYPTNDALRTALDQSVRDRQRGVGTPPGTNGPASRAR